MTPKPHKPIAMHRTHSRSRAGFLIALLACIGLLGGCEIIENELVLLDTAAPEPEVPAGLPGAPGHGAGY